PGAGERHAHHQVARLAGEALRRGPPGEVGPGRGGAASPLHPDAGPRRARPAPRPAARAAVRPLVPRRAARAGLPAARSLRPDREALRPAEAVGAAVTTDPHPPRSVGIQPRFPGVLGRWRWLTDPVPAE